MQCGHRAPRKELLGHAWIINLVHDHVKLMQLGKCIHLKLPSPSPISPDPLNVVVNVFVIFDKELVQLLVLLDVLDTLSPKLNVMLLVAFKLIRQCTEHAVAISAYLFNFQTKSSQLLPKFDHVNIVFGSIKFLLCSSHLTLGPTLFFFVVLGL